MTAILVTGSRNAEGISHQHTISLALHGVGPGDHTLWHGAATGADRIAAHIAHGLGWAVESIPADWNGPCVETCTPGHRRPRRGGGTYCPAAGTYRNTALVAAVFDHLPDVRAYAFPLPGSKGTWDAVRQIKAAGIPLEVVHLGAVAR